jgi:hypothetical protein
VSATAAAFPSPPRSLPVMTRRRRDASP